MFLVGEDCNLIVICFHSDYPEIILCPFDPILSQNHIWQNTDRMSGKVRQRTSANAADSATQTVNERILKECHKVYTDPDNGEL